MAAVILAPVFGFDHGFVALNLIDDILARKVENEAYVDSKTVFDVLGELLCFQLSRVLAEISQEADRIYFVALRSTRKDLKIFSI